MSLAAQIGLSLAPRRSCRCRTFRAASALVSVAVRYWPLLSSWRWSFRGR